MTYLEKINNYYYLTKNIRIDNKWKKVRIYIGKIKPTKEQIQKLTKEIEKKQISSKYTYLSNKEAEFLEDVKLSFKQWLIKTPKIVKEKYDEDFIIRFTYNTNSIEGNKLTLRETSLILKDKVLPTGVSAIDYNEAINGKECLEYIKQYKGDLNKEFLEKVNELLVKNTNVIYKGKVRQFNVKIVGSNYVPPDYKELKSLLNNMFKWYKSNVKKLHPFELATMIHGKIAGIHPFEDGNGRTARAIMNWILIKEEYPMFFIPYEKRKEYYEAIDFYDNKKYKEYVSKMLSLIEEQVKDFKN
jgi:Fic family protein